MVDEKEKDISGTNKVDVSPETIEDEWGEIVADEKIELLPKGAPGDSENSEGAPDIKPENTVDRCTGALYVLGSIGFSMVLPAWQVTAPKVEGLAKVWGKVLAKYIPAGWVRYLPDVSGDDGSVCVECDAIMATVQFLDEYMPSETEPEKKQQAAEPSQKKPEPQAGAMLDKSEIAVINHGS